MNLLTNLGWSWLQECRVWIGCLILHQSRITRSSFTCYYFKSSSCQLEDGARPIWLIWWLHHIFAPISAAYVCPSSRSVLASHSTTTCFHCLFRRATYFAKMNRTFYWCYNLSSAGRGSSQLTSNCRMDKKQIWQDLRYIHIFEVDPHLLLKHIFLSRTYAGSPAEGCWCTCRQQPCHCSAADHWCLIWCKCLYPENFAMACRSTGCHLLFGFHQVKCLDTRSFLSCFLFGWSVDGRWWCHQVINRFREENRSC